MPSYASSAEHCLLPSRRPPRQSQIPITRQPQNKNWRALRPQVPRGMGLTFSWNAKEASAPTQAIPSLGPEVRTLPLPKDRRAHPTAQPPRTRGSRGAHFQTATSAASFPAHARPTTDHSLPLLLLRLLPLLLLRLLPLLQLWLLLVLVLHPRPVSPVVLLGALQPGAGRTG